MRMRGWETSYFVDIIDNARQLLVLIYHTLSVLGFLCAECWKFFAVVWVKKET